MQKEDVTEAMLQKKLRTLSSNPQYIIENLYIFDWESDFLIKTRSGLWYEYECKITLADFKADFKKIAKHSFFKGGQYWRWRVYKFVKDEADLAFFREYPNMYYIERDRGRWAVFTRYTLVEGAKRPNYFSYCVPWYLEDKVKPLLPTYAGLAVMTEDGAICQVVPPPRLHSEKILDKDLKLTSKFYYNWRHEKEKNENNVKDKTIQYLKNYVAFVKAEYKAAVGYDIKEVL